MNTTVITHQEIRCPICHRKLMIIRRKMSTKPVVEALSKNKDYIAETRCPSCKAYVGINA